MAEYRVIEARDGVRLLLKTVRRTGQPDAVSYVIRSVRPAL